MFSVVVTLREKIFYVFSFVMLMNAFVSSFFVSNVGGGYQENKSLQVILVGIYCVTLLCFMLLKYINQFVQDLKSPVFLVALWAIVSSCWSHDFLFSLQKSVALFLTTFFGYYLFRRLTLDEFIGLIGVALSIVVFSSLFVCLFFPSIGIDQGLIHNGSWKGVFPQKQVFAQVLTLYLAYLFAFKSSYTKYWLALLIVSICCLLKTGSATGIVISSLAVMMTCYVMLKNRLTAQFGLFLNVSFLLVFILIFIFINYLLLDLFGALGKDLTFSGRVYLWEIALDSIGNSPIAGYGYKSFWQSSSEMVFLYLDYYAVNAHNSLLDIWLDLGLVGLLFNFYIVFMVGKNSYRHYKEFGDGNSLFVLMFIFLMLSFSSVATIFPNQNTHVWAFLVSFYFFFRYGNVAR